MSLNGLKWLKDKPIIYYIDNNIYFSTSLAKMPQHKSADVICQCGAILKVYYMPNHLRTAKHARDMVGRENIEVVSRYKYDIFLNRFCT